MTCIILEDQAPAQRILQKFISDYGSLELKATFSDPIEALAYLKKETVNLMFLDIHLPKISGLSFLKTLDRKPYTIFTTAYSDYALEGYELNVVDYLLKPFSFERFVQAVLKVPSKLKIEDNFASEIFIKSGYEFIKVDIPKIFYIKADMDYTLLKTKEQKFLSSESLKHWQETLNPAFFIRIHKSFIVNMKHVEKVVGSQVHLSNGEAIPIGRAFKEELMRFLDAD